MASLRTLTPIFIVLSIIVAISSASDRSDLVAELLELQSRSPTGVIHLNDRSLARFLTAVEIPRPYSLVVFFDAVQLHDKQELHLKELRSEFGVVASSFAANSKDPSDPSHGKLFFVEIEFKESQQSFALFGVNALPHIRLVSSAKSPKDSDHMDQGDFSRLADAMAEFVESRTRISVGPITRPPIVSGRQLAFAALALLIWTPFAAKKVISGKTILHEPRLWLAGAVFVYFFSVSGAMHNIIRKMPMFLADREDPNKLVFFYQGSGMQLGAEGFAIGSLYTVVGLLLALVTRVLVRVRSVNVQRGVMIFAMFVSFWAVKKVIQLDNWKTGYGIHAFWPTSWN